jgi:hypothetical protein
MVTFSYLMATGRTFLISKNNEENTSMHTETLQYIYYNILLLPDIVETPLLGICYVAIGALSALATSIIMFVLAYEDRAFVPIGNTLLYCLIGFFFLWASFIYILATFGVLGIPSMTTMTPPSYGNYLRPVLAILLLSPAFVALINRKVR